jgi:hypothetical protein
VYFQIQVLPLNTLSANETYIPSLNIPGYFEEDGHRAMLYVEDPDEISFEPEQSTKLRELGLKRRPVRAGDTATAIIMLQRTN